MKETTIVISLLLILLAIPALSHVNQSKATVQTVRNVALTTDSVDYVGTVKVSTLPASTGPPPGSLPQLLSHGSLSKSRSQAAAASFALVNVQPGSSYITVAKSLEGTPGYNPNPCLCAPSDMGLGASSQYVFQMVNLAGTIYTTSGAVAKPSFSLEDFWFADVRSMSDPQIVYDARSGHWFASILIIVNHIRFAVSATSDPLGIWYIYSLRVPGPSSTFPASNILPDQPFIGYSDDKFLMSANDFVYDTTTGFGAFVGAQYWIVDKAAMIAGAAKPAVQTNTPTLVNTPNGSEDFRIDPMQQLSPGNNAYMAENCEVLGYTFCPEFGPGITNGGITVFTVTGLPPNAVVTRVTVPAALTGTPSSADQPNHPGTLATNDERMVSAVYNNGRIWTALNDKQQCPTASCVRLDEIAVSEDSTTILQDFDFTLNGAATFYGAVSMDAANSLVVMFETSSLSMYPSLLVTGQLSNESPNTLAKASIVQQGSAADLTTRWGDYYYATTQPGAISTFWVSGGYRTIELFEGWQTRIGQITFSGPGVPPPPPPPPPCQESDGNGDFQGQQKGNFNFDNDGCMDGDQNQVSSTNRGDGRSFQSTLINSVQLDSLAHTITISGVGVSNGVTVGFTLVALETGPTTPGWVSLSFTDGYVNSGLLLNGSIALH